MAEQEVPNRRPIKTRSSQWARQTALALARWGLTPNQISIASSGFAILGAALLWRAGTPVGILGCALCIQARLICNLLDGMVAIEGGQKSALGQLYNEFPDRVADSVLIVALGYAVQSAWLGWLGALLAALTAYVRVFGGALGLPQDFRGPLAKQQRMAVLTAGCVLGAVEIVVWGTRWALIAAAWSIAAGAAVTCVTRTRAIAQRLQEL